MLGVAASRVSYLVHGKFNRFDFDELVPMAVNAGLTVVVRHWRRLTLVEGLTEGRMPHIDDLVWLTSYAGNR